MDMNDTIMYNNLNMHPEEKLPGFRGNLDE